ncbi:MAG: hypothetical protein OEV78_07915 [Spirochaetia bacterium]|nr:hypothetical protein [Spirochaetia bacterium]
MEKDHSIQTFQEGDLKVQIEESKYIIKISWLGQCTLKNPSFFLDPILTEQYGESQKSIKRMVFDFTKFKFMNSSAIIPIIRILKMAKDSRASVHVLYNQNERWQSILLGELKIFETEDGRIQVLGANH